MGRAPRILLAAILAASALVSVTPSARAEAVSFEEAWDDYTTGVWPPIPTANRIPGWTYTTEGTSGAISLTPTPSVSGQSLATEAYSIGLNTARSQKGVALLMDTAAFPCDGGDSQIVEFDIQFDAFPTTAVSQSVSSYSIALTNVADTSRFVWDINEDGNGASTARIFTSTGATHAVSLNGPNMVVDTWYHITMGAFDCDEESFYISKVKQADGTEFGVASVDGNNLAGVVSSPDKFNQGISGSTTNTGGSSASMGATFLDNLEVAYDGVVPPDRLPIFCSARGNEHFGYNYDEDVERHGDLEFGGITGGYLFKGDADNFAYLGAGFSPGTKAAKVFFRIEARAEGAASVFRAAFSTVDTTTYHVGTDPVLFDSDAKGNGLTTGVFSDYIEVRFKEVDNDWNIQLYYVDGGGSRTQLGQAVVAGNPNTPTSFSFQVDTRAGQSYASVTYADGLPIGTGVLNKTLASIASNHFIDDTLKSQWFVGYAVDNFVNLDAQTILDDAGRSSSTCIYGLEEGVTPVKVGDPGASGPALGPTGVPVTLVDPNDECITSGLNCTSPEGPVAASELFAPSPAACELFGSCPNASGFMGFLYVMFVGAGIGALPVADAEVEKKRGGPGKVNWKVVGGFALFGILAGAVTGYYLLIVPIGVLALVVLAFVALIVLGLVKAFRR